MEKTYIALDLETTGFEADHDQVIEIAAIKFQGDQIIDQFETLVNPEVPIPPMVSHITGITEKDIQNAPKFEEVQDKLMEFIGNHPIIGHNIDFDLTFLKAKGLPIKNKQFDTLHLAGILLPGLPSYSLDTISRILKLTHQNKHRAMSDTHVCFELFNLLRKKIAEIPENTLKEINRLIKKSDWHLGEIFLEFENEKQQPPKKVSQNTVNQENFEDLKINFNQPTDFFTNEKIAQKIFPNYEIRESQKILSQEIYQSFYLQNHLIAEAPTGSGKTFAYLLASAIWSKKFQEKIVISTNTNNLQDQIFKKDLPLIQKLYPNLKVAILKGRKNYFSPSRFNSIINKNHLEEHELLMAIKVVLWLLETKTGDLEELNLHNKELTLLDDICCLNNESAPTKQDIKKRLSEENFLNQARLNAESSDIIIINHSLLIQDSLSENSLLPSYHYLIIDEAHHLEKTATDALTIDLTPNKYRKLLENLEEIELRNPQIISLFNQNKKFTGNINALAQNALEKVENFFDYTADFLNEFGKPLNLFPLHLTVNFLHLKTSQWQELENKLKDLNSDLKEISKNLTDLIKAISLDDDHNLQDTLLTLEYYQNQLLKLRTDSESLLFEADQNIVWINRTHDENLHFQKAPLKIGEELQNLLYQNKKSIIFTSATLTTNNNFDYTKHELGLTENIKELKLKSHFTYPEQVKIIIPEDLPLDPRSDEYLKDCEELIGKIIEKNGGRSLILFTSKKDLSRIFYHLAPKLKQTGFNLLAQGISGGRGKIISHFQDEPENSALMGTNSFWEGLDLVGELLNCLIIQKLPFDPPEDPVFRARSKRFRNEFNDYSLPRAILRFKQGFGRLIRTAEDTGTTIMLDSRLVHKEYGKNFLASLPEGIQIHQCSKNDVISYL